MGFVKSTLAACATVGTHLTFSLGYVTPELTKLLLQGTVVSAEFVEKLARYTADQAQKGESMVDVLILAMEHKEESICSKIKAWAEREEAVNNKEFNDLLADLLKFNKGKTNDTI